jgi:hypothetical protein
MKNDITSIATIDLSALASVTGGKRKETDLERGVRAGRAAEKASNMAKDIHKRLTGK